MNDKLIEELLNEDESSYLDFKRDQYPFDKATDEEKSELIKDIIAFANAWRRSDAYILIGVDDIQGGRSLVVSVNYHLNESNLQQLVKSKTQRPVLFSYQAYEFEGTQIGIITIPVQERPIYLIKDFGRLKKEVVYIRRGSSTDEANPDEIARMGAATAIASREIPELNLQFADIDARTELGNEIVIKNTILEPLLDPESLKSPKKFGGWQLPESLYDPNRNPNYEEDLIQYVAKFHKFKPIGFVIENKSGELAIGVQFKATIMIRNGLQLINNKDGPKRPQYNYTLFAVRHTLPELLKPVTYQPDPIISKFGDHWELTIGFGKILPRSKVWSTGVIYIVGDNSQKVDIVAALYAENLPNPITLPLSIKIETEKRPMERTDLRIGHPRLPS